MIRCSTQFRKLPMPYTIIIRNWEALFPVLSSEIHKKMGVTDFETNFNRI